MEELKVLTKRVGEELKEETLTGESTLKILQEFVGGYIEVVRLGNNVDLWLNEEGKLDGLKENLVFERNGNILDVVVGNCLFATNDEEGDTVSLTDEQIEYVKSIYKVDMFQKEELDGSFNNISALSLN